MLCEIRICLLGNQTVLFKHYKVNICNDCTCNTEYCIPYIWCVKERKKTFINNTKHCNQYGRKSDDFKPSSEAKNNKAENKQCHHT